MSDSGTSATRRAVIATAAASLAVSVPAVAAAEQQEDPELLALGAEFETYLVRFRAADAVADVLDEEVFNAVMEEQWPLYTRILSRRPRAAVGIGIMARALSLSGDELPDTAGPNDIDTHVCLFIEAMCAVAGVQPAQNLRRREV